MKPLLGAGLITSQNHGYAVNMDTLKDSGFREYFRNLNDGSNEGMIHETRPIFSTQFHPEAKGGPMDSAYLFDTYIEKVREYKEKSGGRKEGRPSQLLVDMLAKERVGVETDAMKFGQAPKVGEAGASQAKPAPTAA